ncbi:MAG TPA: FAD-dependent oxidoreductase [Syntrophales bacterium]|nr:FAD-dependent oxidoreductase [Syntrophales bacterium]HOL58662.1 FAD-dependent oxidoreductase [Syntrophales bacterium]HPO35050.1 FAD-dependent oxidoreductase [Syntrophales bacterium]
MERFPVIIVGAGLAGLACAYTLAKAGTECLVLERGDYAGAKSVTGGRLYLEPVRTLFSDLWGEDCPLERKIVKEGLTLMGKEGALSLELAGGVKAASYSILRARFDRWLAEKAEEAGAMIMTKAFVSCLVKEGEKIVGVQVGNEILKADCVVVADGALSLLTEGVGLHPPVSATNLALGVKEVIALSRERIEERFQLAPGEGAARLYVGEVTAGNFGGGFLYTNSESISLGLVVACEMHAHWQAPAIPSLLDRFKSRPEVEILLRGGETVEYAAHLIPEGGRKGMLPLSAPGLLVVGDAAGLALNLGYTVRGMDYALASGYYAARAIEEGLPHRYPEMVAACFIGKDLENYRAMREFLGQRRLYNHYPQKVVDFLADLYTIPAGEKERLFTIWRRHFPWREVWRVWRDFKELRRT